MILPLAGLFAQTTKVGHMNVELVMVYMPESEVVEKELETYAAQLEKSLKIKQKYFLEKKDEFLDKMEGGGYPNETAKQQAEAELIKLQQEIYKSSNEADQKINEKQMTLMKPILEKLQNAIDEVAKEGNFTYILNVTSGTNILYGAENYNVTDLVAKKIGVTIPKE